MRVVPLGDKVVVKRLDAEERTAGGILLPDAARQKPHQGRVLSVGDGRLLPSGERVPHSVQEGDRVLFTAWTGSEVTVADEDVLILSEADILAVME